MGLKIGGVPLQVRRTDVATFVAFAFAWDASAAYSITTHEIMGHALSVEPALLLVFFTTLGLCHRKMELLLSRKTVVAACILGALGVAVAFGGAALSEGSALCGLISATLITAFQAFIMVFCLTRLSTMTLSRTVLCLVGWQLCLGFLTLVDNFIPPDMFTGLCIAGCAACLVPRENGLILTLENPLSSESISEKAPRERAERHSLPLRLFAANALFVFMVYALHSVMPQEALRVSHVGTIVGVIAVVAWYVRTHPVMKFRTLYNMALVFSEAAIVIFALGTAACVALSAILLDVAYGVFVVFYYALLCNIRLRYGINPILLFAVANAIECVAASLGGLVSYTPLGAESLHLLPVVLSAGMVVAFTCFATSEDIVSSWGTERRPKNVTDPSVYYATLVELCASIAMQYGLSRKESEVLLLLAQRKTAPEIAKELFVAVGTVKTHMHNIYRKLGIHSKKELLELVGCSER